MKPRHMGRDTTGGCIDKGQSCFAALPRREKVRCPAALRADIPIGGVESPEFKRWITFQFLHEVTMPMQTGLKAADPTTSEATACLNHLSHRQTSPSEIGGEAGTTGESGVGAGDRACISRCPVFEEIIQFQQCH